jgi:hypothetical protein
MNGFGVVSAPADLTTLSAATMGRTLEDYADVFDDELGVAGFPNRATDTQVLPVRGDNNE